MLTDDQIRGATVEFFSRYLRTSVLDNDQNIFKSGIVNSLFAMQIIMFVESEFSISVESEDMKISNFSSVNSLTHFVRSKTSQERHG